MSSGEPTAEDHAEQIRGFFSDAMNADTSGESATDAAQSPAETSSSAGGSRVNAGAKPGGRPQASVAARRGPSVHRYNLGTWGTYHAARIAAHSLAGAVRGTSDRE